MEMNQRRTSTCRATKNRETAFRLPFQYLTQVKFNEVQIFTHLQPRQPAFFSQETKTVEELRVFRIRLALTTKTAEEIVYRQS